MRKKIYYHDTDCGGVVYYANYLKYFEEARTEFFGEKGIDLARLAQEGTLFVVRRLECDYKFPARYADTIEITTAIGRVKNVSLEFLQSAKKKDTELIKAKTTLVCIDRQFSPQPIPPPILAVLK